MKATETTFYPKSSVVSPFIHRIRAAAFLLLGCIAAAQTLPAATPLVTNVTAQQQTWPSFIVDINYDVFDMNGHALLISAAVSTNSGMQYDILTTNLSGDIGYPILVGTNKYIAWDAGIDLPSFSSDTVRVKITAEDFAGTGSPFVNITNTSPTVINEVAAFPVAGTNNIHVVGSMWVINDATAAQLAFPAAASWVAPPIGLVVGANQLYVYGTNTRGEENFDFVFVTRSPAGTSPPFIDITNAPAIFPYDTTSCSIAGTNNAQVMGDMWWTNNLTGANGSVQVSSFKFHVSNITLAVGSNIITVYGTNALDIVTNDTVVVTRGDIGTGAPFLAITSEPSIVTYDVTAFTIGGTNNEHVVGFLWWTNTLNAAHGATPVSSFEFQVSNIPLAVGANTIHVFGTNAWGVLTTDSIVITRAAQVATGAYLVIDVSGGPTASTYPLTYLTNAPTLSNEFKTTKILLRLIPAGTFLMGSPASELGRETDELRHTVTLNSNFYMGVFEITQAQYTNVMGGPNPAIQPGAMRPIEEVAWFQVRGGTWPGYPPATGSFTGILRAKTGLSFDLPTEAQWEYACRAGTTNALNSNKNLYSTGLDTNLNVLGKYARNGGSAGYHVIVGSYLPNNWGLYDMHGNVWEFCLDYYASNYYAEAAIDPPGPSWLFARIIRGGSWEQDAYQCRSAYRNWNDAAVVYGDIGFRLSLTLAIPGTPFLDITNDDHSVTYDTTTATIGGTNNRDVVGGLIWSNTLNAAHGSTPVSSFTFQVSSIPLSVGSNTIIVFATNAWGIVTNDTVIITRLAAEYCIIDLSGGPSASNYLVTYQSAIPPTNDVHKTTRISLRRIPAGSFVMGSPTNELGRSADEGPQHTVTFTSAYYVGVFEITQAQYTNVMGGANPSAFPGDLRPVERVSWDTVRGGTWPSGSPTNITFMGLLRSRTGLAFDLPTEAQWEHACRAGTTNALYNNENLTNTLQDANVDILARYSFNSGTATNHAPVGSYLPNAWGLHDMLGNVYELCLDWYADTYDGDATEPPGPSSSGLGMRMIRGGEWGSSAMYCRSANRGVMAPASMQNYVGFRICLPAKQ